MFIEINGHVVNGAAIVQMTPNGGVQLVGGSVVHAKDDAERQALRAFLLPSHDDESLPEHEPATAEQVCAEVTANDSPVPNQPDVESDLG